MSIVTLKGEFVINGKTFEGMDVKATESIRFNDASGVLAVVATGKDGKVVKGVAMADEQLILQLATLGRNSQKDTSIRVPEFN